MATLERLEKLRELRTLLGPISEKESFSFSLLPGGVPKGGVTEVTGSDGSGKTEAILRLLAEHPESRVAWVEPELSIYPRVFPLLGVSLSRVVFVEGQRQSAWAATQLLKSQLFPFVVLDRVDVGETELRRVQLAAEGAKSALILINEDSKKSGRWSVQLKLRVTRPCKNIGDAIGVDIGDAADIDIHIIKGATSWTSQAR